jgi:hypothetical protein
MRFVVGGNSGAGFKTSKPTTTQNCNIRSMFIPIDMTCIISTWWQIPVMNFVLHVFNSV